MLRGATRTLECPASSSSRSNLTWALKKNCVYELRWVVRLHAMQCTLSLMRSPNTNSTDSGAPAARTRSYSASSSSPASFISPVRAGGQPGVSSMQARCGAGLPLTREAAHRRQTGCWALPPARRAAALDPPPRAPVHQHAEPESCPAAAAARPRRDRLQELGAASPAPEAWGGKASFRAALFARLGQQASLQRVT